jgi:hypothetical protein
MKNRTYRLASILVTSAATFICPCRAFAQQVNRLPERGGSDLTVAAAQQNVPAKAQEAEDTVERTVKRFGVGAEAGVGLNPQVIAFGVHATFGPVFSRNVQFRPGIEFGVGEVTTTFGINLDALYTFPGATRETRWTPYVGAGPNFFLSHRGFDSASISSANRFNFSDTRFNAGLNFIAGARSRNRLFLEMRASAYGVSNVRLLAGFSF